MSTEPVTDTKPALTRFWENLKAAPRRFWRTMIRSG